MPFSAPESNPDLFDILVALRFLQRHGDGPEARYRKTEETALFLDRRSPQVHGRLSRNGEFSPVWILG